MSRAAFLVADELPLSCYDCGVVLGEGAACPETTNVCRPCHNCDETCVPFATCYVCGTLTQNFTDYPSGPRCVEYFACARRKDERHAVIARRSK